ncbi:hypothetical protein A6J42_16795 [Leptospira interrogans serovar Copenhageni]|nr:hypothetical protein A6J42_16795 [Leptospira interrogans serovar Copenhageni]
MDREGFAVSQSHIVFDLSSTSSFSHAHLPGSRRVFSLFTKAQNALARKLRILLTRFLFCCMIKL